MKHVFNRSNQIVHLWANKTQDRANTRNASFSGDVYRSYSTCIARHLKDGYVAIATDRWSSTTSGHIQEVKWATKHLKQVFVPDPYGSPDSARAKRDVDGLLNLAAKARQRRPEHLAKAASIIENFNLYSKLAGHKVRMKKLDIEGFSPEKLKAAMLAREKAEKAREKAREKKATQEAAEAITRWRNHDPVSRCDIYYVATMLRLCEHAGDHSMGRYFIETSRGANIPAADAVRLWPVIQRVMAGDRDYEVGMELGGYRLTRICRNGDITVGCHDIPYKEIEAMFTEMSAKGLFNKELEAA